MRATLLTLMGKARGEGGMWAGKLCVYVLRPHTLSPIVNLLLLAGALREQVAPTTALVPHQARGRGGDHALCLAGKGHISPYALPF